MTTPHSVSSTSGRSENYSNRTSSKNRLFYANIFILQDKIGKVKTKMVENEFFIPPHRQQAL